VAAGGMSVPERGREGARLAWALDVTEGGSGPRRDPSPPAADAFSAASTACCRARAQGGVSVIGRPLPPSLNAHLRHGPVGRPLAAEDGHEARARVHLDDVLRGGGGSEGPPELPCAAGPHPRRARTWREICAVPPLPTGSEGSLTERPDARPCRLDVCVRHLQCGREGSMVEPRIRTSSAAPSRGDRAGAAGGRRRTLRLR